jgi:hypothetical protein
MLATVTDVNNDGPVTTVTFAVIITTLSSVNLLQWLRERARRSSVCEIPSLAVTQTIIICVVTVDVDNHNVSSEIQPHHSNRATALFFCNMRKMLQLPSLYPLHSLTYFFFTRSKEGNLEQFICKYEPMYKVVQIWPRLTVCKLVTVCPGHIWTTLYISKEELSGWSFVAENLSVSFPVTRIKSVINHNYQQLD